MSIYAKVSLAAVSNFKDSVNRTMAIDSQFHGALGCLREVNQYIDNQAQILHNVVPSLESAQSTVQKKIEKIEACISQLNAKLNGLRSRLASVMAKLAVTPPFLKRKDSEGNAYLIDNPAYTALCNQAEALEAEISAVEQDLVEQENQLHRAQDVLRKIEVHCATISRSIDVLELLSNDCVKLTDDIERIRNRNARQASHAYDLLVKIEQIINRYLAVKLLNEGGSLSCTQNFAYSNNIAGGNRTNDCTNNFESIHVQQNELVFFTEYIDRINQTPNTNSPNGFWTGLRGESIFVPSPTTEKGKAGLARLKRYGLLGIKYSNGEPDYSSCSEGTVTIENMTADRGSNFEQADIVLAEQWNLAQRDGKKDWTDEDVEYFRKSNKLSWHECCDTKTMHLVSRHIHGCETSVFLHSGGVAECKRRDNNRGGFDE